MLSRSVIVIVWNFVRPHLLDIDSFIQVESTGTLPRFIPFRPDCSEMGVILIFKFVWVGWAREALKKWKKGYSGMRDAEISSGSLVSKLETAIFVLGSMACSRLEYLIFSSTLRFFSSRSMSILAVHLFTSW